MALNLLLSTQLGLKVSAGALYWRSSCKGVDAKHHPDRPPRLLALQDADGASSPYLGGSGVRSDCARAGGVTFCMHGM